MSQTALSSSSPAAGRFVADDWITLAGAAELTGVSKRTLTFRCTHSWRKGGLAELRPPPGGRGKDCWWINRLVDKALALIPDRRTRQDRARDPLLKRYAAHAVDKAYKRAHWLNKWRTACTRDRRPELVVAVDIVTEAKRIEGEDFLISPRSLQIWHASYNAIATGGRIAGIEALVNRSGNAPGETRTAPSRSSEAVDYFYGLWRNQSGHTVKTCHTATVEAAKTNGWHWPSGVRSTHRWLSDHDQLDVTLAHRDPKAYRRKFMAHLDRDTSNLPVGHTYVFDHARLDLWCVADGDKVRPWLTGITDQRSRCLVGWHIGLVPHSDAIIAAMRMAFKDWAVCDTAYMDNGSDFCSAMISGPTKRERLRYRREMGPDWRAVRQQNSEVFFSGILGELGAAITYALPRSPWSKPIERAFGTFHDQFDRTFATYCGKDAVSRPECLPIILRGYTDAQKHALKRRHGDAWKKAVVLKLVDESDIPSLDKVRSEFADYVLTYHSAVHTGESMNGDSPLAVWRGAGSLRKADDAALMTLLQARGIYRVGPNGVSFMIGGARMTYGALSGPLRRFVGRDVFITVDPADCGFCHAFTSESGSRVHIDRLAANDRIPADTPVEQLREAIKAVAHRRKILTRAVREAPRRVRNASQELRAMRTAKADELRRTGTDDTKIAPAIVAVRTGFEDASIPDCAADRRQPDEYDDIDIMALAGGAAPPAVDDPEDDTGEYDADDSYALLGTINPGDGDDDDDDDDGDPYAVNLEDLPVTDDPDRTA